VTGTYAFPDDSGMNLNPYPDHALDKVTGLDCARRWDT